MAAPTKSVLNLLWQMGGKVCDLPGCHLDFLARAARVSRHRPVSVARAQRLLNARRAGEVKP